jgi:hypothetical protein
MAAPDLKTSALRAADSPAATGVGNVLARLAILRGEMEDTERSPLRAAIGWGLAAAFSLSVWAAIFAVVR